MDVIITIIQIQCTRKIELNKYCFEIILKNNRNEIKIGNKEISYDFKYFMINYIIFVYFKVDLFIIIN